MKVVLCPLDSKNKPNISEAITLVLDIFPDIGDKIVYNDITYKVNNRYILYQTSDKNPHRVQYTLEVKEIV